jgi:hypothetical protein
MEIIRPHFLLPQRRSYARRLVQRSDRYHAVEALHSSLRALRMLQSQCADCMARTPSARLC